MDCLGLLVFIICDMCVVYVSLSCGALAVAYFNQPTWHPLYPAIQEDYQEEYPTWHKGSSHCEAYPVNLTMETVWNSPCMWFPRRDLRSYFAYIGTNKDRVNTIKSINRQGCQQMPYCFILFSSCFRFEHFPTRCRSIPLPVCCALVCTEGQLGRHLSSSERDFKYRCCRCLGWKVFLALWGFMWWKPRAACKPIPTLKCLVVAHVISL